MGCKTTTPTEEELVKETVKKGGGTLYKKKKDSKRERKLMSLHILPVFLLWWPTKEKQVREDAGAWEPGDIRPVNSTKH